MARSARSNYRGETVTMADGGAMNLAVWTPDRGSGPGMEAAVGKVGQLDFQQAVEDFGAALDAVADVRGRRRLRAVRAVSYNGSEEPAMLSKLERITGPILFHFGSLDDYIAGEGVDALVAEHLSCPPPPT